jgi:hypothetical protein
LSVRDLQEVGQVLTILTEVKDLVGMRPLLIDLILISADLMEPEVPGAETLTSGEAASVPDEG